MFATFELFGKGHLGALALIAVIATLLIRKCRQNPQSPGAKTGIALLAFLCFAAYPINLAALFARGGDHSLNVLLPLHLCDIAAIICGFALIKRHPLLCELAYFWGLAGTLQGLITPDISYNFPDPSFLAFFNLHGVIVITALLLPLGLGWRPYRGAPLRAMLWILIYAAIIFPLNMVLDTNFGYLMEKPSKASLLDVMGPWPWYILSLIGLACLFFFLLNLPFRKKHIESP